MDEISRAVEQLLGRASGPMHIRLLIQPVVAITIAIRAGLRDARENKSPPLWEWVKNTAQWRALAYLIWIEIGQLLVVAFAMDCLYQLFFLKSFYLLQAIIVIFVLAVIPYFLFRGMATLLRRRFCE